MLFFLILGSLASRLSILALGLSPRHLFAHGFSTDSFAIMSKRKIGEVYDDGKKSGGGGTGDAKAPASAIIIAAGSGLPVELDDLVPEMLDMRSLSSLACTGVRWRDASVREMLGRLRRSDFGKRWTLRAEIFKASTEYTDAMHRRSVPDNAVMVGALDSQGPPYFRCSDPTCPEDTCFCKVPDGCFILKVPTVISAPRGIWRRFIFGCRQSSAAAPAEHPAGAAICRRAIHQCNTSIRGIRHKCKCIFEGCEEYIEPPTRYFTEMTCPAYGRAMFKRVLQSNALISCLTGASSILHDRDREAIAATETPGSSSMRDFGAAYFLQGTGVLSLDDTSCSWPVWAVYDGLMPTFVAIALGLADLDCPVPVRLPSDHGTEWPLPAAYKHQPLREWLYEHRSWIGPDIIRLFQLAAGEKADADIDDDDASDAGTRPEETSDDEYQIRAI